VTLTSVRTPRELAEIWALVFRRWRGGSAGAVPVRL